MFVVVVVAPLTLIAHGDDYNSHDYDGESLRLVADNLQSAVALRTVAVKL